MMDDFEPVPQPHGEKGKRIIHGSMRTGVKVTREMKKRQAPKRCVICNRRFRSYDDHEYETGICSVCSSEGG